MNEQHWLQLKVGDNVEFNDIQWTVSEICTEQRFLDKWIERGHENIDRIIKFDQIGYALHTWMCWTEDREITKC